MGRTASGVRGITLGNPKDEVVGMICVDSENDDTSVLVVSEKGYGKRTDVDDYRITNRGGKGVKTINVTDKTGQLIALKAVTDEDDLMIINKTGITIRMAVEDLRVMGRATQGVRLINLKGSDEIAAVAKVPAADPEEEEEVAEGEAPDVTAEGETSADDQATDEGESSEE